MMAGATDQERESILASASRKPNPGPWVSDFIARREAAEFLRLSGVAVNILETQYKPLESCGQIG